MKHPLLRGAIVIVLALLAGTMLPAQTPTGTIDGVVRDASGALIPRAQVVV